MIEYLPGFERRLRGNNGAYATGGPWTLLLHTTEGGLLGSIGTLDARNVWPQLLVDFTLGRRIQAYPLSMPGRSLADRAGGVYTNRRGRVVQVEIVGFARQSHLWGDGVYRFLADSLRPLFGPGGVGAYGTRFYGEGDGLLASTSAFQRFPGGVWNGFGGVCGHQHAPENDHWDPGRFDVDRFLRFVGTSRRPAPTPPPISPLEETVDLLIQIKPEKNYDGDLLCVVGGVVKPVPDLKTWSRWKDTHKVPVVEFPNRAYYKQWRENRHHDDGSEFFVPLGPLAADK